MELSAQIEAVLFMRGEAVEIKQLAKLFEVPEAEIKQNLTVLSSTLEGRGLSLVRTETHAELRTAEGASAILEKMQKEDLSGSIGKAGIETLAILLYKGSSTRSDIEYIRGVNAGAALRTLLVRGLVTRMVNPEDSRSYVYKPTTEALGHLGVESKEDLPNYEEFTKELAALEETLKEKDDERE
ncbi:MAG: SMC-Scp complex subunit ScpB [Patescibacteria group bacterium UBA2103]